MELGEGVKWTWTGHGQDRTTYLCVLELQLTFLSRLLTLYRIKNVVTTDTGNANMSQKIAKTPNQALYSEVSLIPCKGIQ
jgi:hypothetical protein